MSSPFVALALAVLALGLTGACKGKDEPAGGARASGAAPVAVAPPPFAGTLTVDRVMGARNLVKPFDPWEPGFAILQAQVGAPTRVDGARHTWAAVEGDACAWFYVTRELGADYQVEGVIVGTVQAPTRATRGEAPVAHAECLRAAGKDPGPPEDPAAAGPPPDGRPVSLSEVRTNVIAGRSRWKDRTVTIAATLGPVTTTSSGADRYVTVALRAGPDDAGAPLPCALEKNAPAPALAAGAAVLATGTMTIQEWTQLGTGEITLRPSLSSCTVTAAP